jgi:hypothetical protein
MEEEVFPKLIQLNEVWEVMSNWGPRPEVAQNLVMELKANAETVDNYAEQLHLWYAKKPFRGIGKRNYCVVENMSTKYLFSK